MEPSRLYATLAYIAKHLNETNSKFICVVACGKDGRYEVYNGNVVDMDDLLGAANAIKEQLEHFQNKSNG